MCFGSRSYLRNAGSVPSDGRQRAGQGGGTRLSCQSKSCHQGHPKERERRQDSQSYSERDDPRRRGEQRRRLPNDLRFHSGKLAELPFETKNLGSWLRLAEDRRVCQSAQKLPGTPFMPPPGCYSGASYLVVPNTPARILVETTTSDPEAQRRLVDLAVKELNNAGITARLEVPEKEGTAPGPVKTSPPAGQPADVRP